jgi:hypothetical protein
MQGPLWNAVLVVALICGVLAGILLLDEVIGNS